MRTLLAVTVFAAGGCALATGRPSNEHESPAAAVAAWRAAAAAAAASNSSAWACGPLAAENPPCAAAGKRGETELCAPEPASAMGCRRPCGMFFLYFRQCAGFVIGKVTTVGGATQPVPCIYCPTRAQHLLRPHKTTPKKGLLDPLLPGSSISWAEAFSLAHEPTNRALTDARARPGWLAMTALKHPVERIVAQFFATCVPTDAPRHERLLPPLVERRCVVVVALARALRAVLSSGLSSVSRRAHSSLSSPSGSLATRAQSRAEATTARSSCGSSPTTSTSR
jgi:hypothetical protein